MSFGIVSSQAPFLRETKWKAEKLLENEKTKKRTLFPYPNRLAAAGAIGVGWRPAALLTAVRGIAIGVKAWAQRAELWKFSKRKTDLQAFLKKICLNFLFENLSFCMVLPTSFFPSESFWKPENSGSKSKEITKNSAVVEALHSMAIVYSRAGGTNPSSDIPQRICAENIWRPKISLCPIW